MGKREMASFKFALVLASLLSLVNAQIPGCSIQGLELGLIEQCLNEAKSSIPMDSCCTALSQAVLAGLHCLCSLLPSSSALFSTPLPLPNCFASAPPLTQCQAPVLQPPPSPALPVLLPPDTPEEPPQEPDLLAPPPPLEAAVTAREMPPGGAAASDLNLTWSRSVISDGTMDRNSLHSTLLFLAATLLCLYDLTLSNLCFAFIFSS